MTFKNTINGFLTSSGGFLAMAFFMTIVAIVMNWPLSPSYGGDSGWYLAMANGNFGGIVKPFTSRFLDPFLAGWLASHFSLNLNQSFLLINIFALLLFFIVIGFLLKKTLRWSPLLLLVLPLPYLIERFGDFFSPDVLYVSLTVLFFFFLFYEREGLALIALFFLFLARESTVLLGFIFLAVTIWRSKKMTVLAALVVVGISFFTAGQIGSLALPNAHHLSDVVYLVLRLPFLTLRNLGIIPWVNTLPGTCEPVFKIGLPHLSILGRIQSFGLCNFDFSMLLTTIISFLSVLGIMPLTLFYLLSKRFSEIWKNTPRWMLIAGLYGLGYFVLTVGSTTGVSRFIGYSWPAFLLVVPFLMKIYFDMDKNFIFKIVALNALAMWSPFLIRLSGGTAVFFEIVVLLIVLVINFYALRLLREQNLKKLQSVSQLAV